MSGSISYQWPDLFNLLVGFSTAKKIFLTPSKLSIDFVLCMTIWRRQQHRNVVLTSSSKIVQKATLLFLLCYWCYCTIDSTSSSVGIAVYYEQWAHTASPHILVRCIYMRIQIFLYTGRKKCTSIFLETLSCNWIVAHRPIKLLLSTQTTNILISACIDGSMIHIL